MSEFGPREKWHRPENHPAVQNERFSPSLQRWLFEKNGIPGIRTSMTCDPGRWGKYCDPDGGTIVQVYDLNFSFAQNSFYFGVV